MNTKLIQTYQAVILILYVIISVSSLRRKNALVNLHTSAVKCTCKFSACMVLVFMDCVNTYGTCNAVCACVIDSCLKLDLEVLCTFHLIGFFLIKSAIQLI